MSEPVPLPSAPPQPAGRWGRRVDALSIGLLLAFAFIAASFVARNSDLWLHLATGRALAQGEYHFGTDPFAYTTAGRYWANHAWLFDLSLYSTFTRFGGDALVLLKSLAVVAITGLMLIAARARGPVWVAVGCILLAVLAMSPRLLLQPTIASLLILAGCLCCLRTGGRALRAVPVLIAVWVNMDAWFVLGPALVAMFQLGHRLDPNRHALTAWPAWLFPVSLGACLLSPHHVFAFRLPMELSPAVWTSAFASDPRFEGVFASPWRWGPLGSAGGYSAAGWASFALLVIGAVSFAVNRPAVRSWRFTVWLPFAALAMWQARLIPFFAVVAGPITALNLRDVWPQTIYPRSGRLLVFTTTVALLALGWVGWLTGVNARDRGFAWGVYTDPTLERAAKGVAQWRHASGVPAQTRVFATHPDVGHYLAWFAPGERYFLDSRLSLFTQDAEEFAELSRTIGVLPGEGGRTLPAEFGAVVLYDPDPGRMTHALVRVTRDNWAVLRIDGGAVLVSHTEAMKSQRFDPDRAAFGGASDLPVAWSGPTRLTEPQRWWRPRRNRVGSWEGGAAAVYLRLADTNVPSPAFPLLAVRAARTGLEVDTDDSLAWLTLGHAYLTLSERTWEREASAGLTPLEQLRSIQAIAALKQAVLANSDSAAAHASLARVFLRRNVLDLAHQHASAAARLVRRAGPGGESPDTFGEQLARMDALADAVFASVQDAQNRFLVRTVGLTGEPLTRARIAAELGLTQQAIDILRTSHPDLYGPVGLGVLADLLLQTGQVEECRTLLDRDQLRRNPSVLGYYNLPRKANPDGSRWPYRLPAYDWLDLCQCAAAGRYSGAQAAIDRLCDHMVDEERTVGPALARGASALITWHVGLSAPPLPFAARLHNLRELVPAYGLITQARALSVTRADLLTVAGVFDLERGDPPTAAARFEQALGLYAAVPAFVASKPGEPLALRYDEAIRATR